MRRLVTSEQALYLDRRTQELQHLSPEPLMNTAGAMAAHQLFEDYPLAKSFVILIGPGHNGGDGLVVARHLLQHPRSEFVIIVCPQEGGSELWQKKRHELEPYSSSLRWVGVNDLESFLKHKFAEPWDVFVDAAFGVGLSRPLGDLWRRCLQSFRERSNRAVAIDVPSGLDATTGVADRGTVTFESTYTMGSAKLGMITGDGPSKCGTIKVLKIGFSPEAYKELQPPIYFVGSREAQRLLPVRAEWSIHKSTRGHLLVLAGSEGMEGAGALAALAGARMGAGYVTWARWPQKGGYRVSVPPHLMTCELDADLRFLTSIKEPTAVVIGPGLGMTPQSRRLVHHVFERFHHHPVVVDADALHLLKLENLFPVPLSWILTPHAGELAQLLDVTVEALLANRWEALQTAQGKLGGHLLFKGFRTLILTPQKRAYVIGAGGPVLSKAGTGDVLSGMIGGALASTHSIERGLCLATYVHGRAGDFYAQKYKNDFTLVASDLPELIPHVLKGLYAKHTPQGS